MDIKVRRGMLVAEVSGSRWQSEAAIMDNYFPHFSIKLNSLNAAISAEAKGTLHTFAGNAYPVSVVAPANYPRSIPVVVPDGWTPIKNPHVYTNGALCLMKAEQWIPQYSLAFFVAKAALWLNKYEIWRTDRIWPGSEQHDHGPLYEFRKWWNDL